MCCSDLHQDLQAGRVERLLQILSDDVWVIGINLCEQDQHADVCERNNRGIESCIIS